MTLHTHLVSLFGTLAITGCASSAVQTTFDPATLPFHVDSARSEMLAGGVTHRFIYTNDGPWAIHLLDVPRSSCVAFRAIKAHHTAAGREPATLQLEQL